MSPNIRSRKSFIMDYENGLWSNLRLPYLRPTEDGYEDSLARQLYENESYPDFNPAKQNQRLTFDPWWNSSPFLDLFLPEGCTWGELTFSGSSNEDIKDAAGMLKAVTGGIDGKDGFTPEVYDPKTGALTWRGEPHYALYGDWVAEDRAGSAIMIPAKFIFPNGRDRKTLEQMLDIKFHITKPEDRLKIRKYFKRLKAPYMWAYRGEFGKSNRVVVREAVTGPANLLGGEVVTFRPAVYGETLEVEFNGLRFTVLFVDIDQFGEDEYAAADGQNIWDVKVARAFGEAVGDQELMKLKDGDTFKFTFAASRKFGKGLCHVKDMKGGPYGLIVYGPKTQLEFNHVYMGSMGDIGEVDDSPAFTDVQSMIMFMTEATQHLWTGMAKIYLQMVQSALYDEDMLRYLFLVHIAPLADMLKPDQPDAEIWSLIEAIRNGVPLLKHPALVEKIARHFLTEVVQQERGRIPYGDKAYLGYFQPDWAMFDFHTGDVDVNQSVIGENEVACTDAPAGVTLVIYRRPIGNNQEAIIAVNLDEDRLRRFRKYKGRGRIIFGRGIRKQYKTAGGGDGDDQAVVITDQALVEAIVRIPQNLKYPLTELPEEVKVELSEYSDLSEYDYYDPDLPDIGSVKVTADAKEWTMAHCWEACDNALALAITIGMVSNVNTLDQQLSGDHKLNMLRRMADRYGKMKPGPRRDFLLKCHNWLLHRKEYVCREIGSNMESFIDNVKMGKGNGVVLEQLWSDALAVRNLSLVYPSGWVGLRVPAKRMLAEDFVGAPSLLDEVKTVIKGYINQVFGRFQERKWANAMLVPTRVSKVFPRSTARVVLGELTVGEAAFELFDMWNDAHTKRMSGKINLAKTEIGHDIRWIILNGGMVYMMDGTSFDHVGVRTRFMQMTTDEAGHANEVLQCAIAVEIARLSYTGLPYQRDGLLWQDFMAKAYINALKRAGLTGWYVPVKLDRRHGDLRTTSKKTLMKESLERTRLLQQGIPADKLELPADATMKVRVVLGAVMRLSDGSFVGDAMGEIEDGEYTMIDSLIEVRPAHPELTGKPAGKVSETIKPR